MALKKTAQQLDQQDPLQHLRKLFSLNPDEVYLDGNSLGPMAFATKQRLDHVIEHQWANRLIRSWNESWIELPQLAAAKIAPLIGTEPQNVICADSVSVNLFKLIAASMSLSPERTDILSVQDMFPTDLYMTQGLNKLMGDIRCNVKLCDMKDLTQSLNANVNIVVLSQVNFRTGEAYDIGAITKQIHAAGARVLWDVSHSVGVLPIDLDQHEIDFAVGCGYKFLNGGPGAPAFVYASEKLQGHLEQPLSGWMGHADPFAFDNQYKPAAGMDRFLAGTPNILSLAALDAALDIYRNIDTNQLFEKAQQLTNFFIELIKQAPELESMGVLSPEHRGAQVTLEHDQAFAITQALIHRGIICDFRTPNFARFGFAPLYISFGDIEKTVGTLIDIIKNETYLEPRFQVAAKVT